MKLLSISNVTYLTGDDAADAVVRYDRALSSAFETDVVRVWHLTKDGTVHEAEVRIGWKTDTSAGPRVPNVGGRHAAVSSDPALVAELLVRCASLEIGLHRGEGFSAEELAQDWPEFE